MATAAAGDGTRGRACGERLAGVGPVDDDNIAGEVVVAATLPVGGCIAAVVVAVWGMGSIICRVSGLFDAGGGGPELGI